MRLASADSTLAPGEDQNSGGQYRRRKRNDYQVVVKA